MRFKLLSSALALCLLTWVAGCKNQSSDSAANTADNNAAGGSDTAKKPESKGILIKTYVLPEGTAIEVVLDEAVGSKISETGQKFDATVERAIEADGKVVIPKGARVRGTVTDAKPAGKFKGGAVLALTLDSVTVEGKSYDIHTSHPTMSSKGKGKRSATMIGGGAAAGAVIGALAGGGKGAAIGAAVGAGAGTGGAAFTGNRDIKLPAETALTFKLTKALEIK